MQKKKRMRSLMSVLGMLCMAVVTGCGTEEKMVSEEVSTSVTEAVTTEEVTTQEEQIIDLTNASLVTDGKLTVGMVIDYPPFEYYPSKGDMPIGVDVDIVNAVADKLGLETDIKNVPWDDALFSNMSSEYDVVCSAVTITDERMKDMIFSDSYMDSYQSVVVRKDSDIAIEKFEDLSGLRVAVQKETVSDELMNEYLTEKSLDITLIENEVATDCFEQLKNGEIDAIVCDSTVTEGQVARSADFLMEAYRDESKVEKFAIAIGKDNQGLQKAVNEALEKIREDGTDKKIINDWFSR